MANEPPPEAALAANFGNQGTKTMFFVTRNGVDRDADAGLRSLQALCIDLKKITDGHRPEAELADAPFLDNYGLTFRMAPCLTGMVQGHPSIDRPAVLTSGLWAYAPELGWARTLNRYYRLGRPLVAPRGDR
jgi:hypothetical protein